MEKLEDELVVAKFRQGRMSACRNGECTIDESSSGPVGRRGMCPAGRLTG
jgi:hypothetical protein